MAIPKPWGEEIWFTGIEKRGVSRVRSTPIAWLLDLFAAVLAPSHQGEAPLLLKILAPHPAPNLGDLYFELHQEKVEVYVVTAIDKDAWPQGQGAIRYGFSPDAVAAQGSADAFREAYLAAVQQYEKVRREIDRLLDEARLAKGIAVDETLPAAMHLTLLQAVPETLRAQEEAARAAMYQYTRLVPLALGDAVQVAPGVPHSLQHGVRVVEFQTPHYERQILSFGQKTLTQDGWDTAAALQLATLLAEPPVLPADPAQALSQLADFEAFTLLRLTLGAGETISIKAPHYALALCVAGQVAVARADAGNGGATLGAEEAIYLQESAAPISLRSLGQEGSITLLAYPPGRSC